MRTADFLRAIAHSHCTALKCYVAQLSMSTARLLQGRYFPVECTHLSLRYSNLLGVLSGASKLLPVQGRVPAVQAGACEVCPCHVCMPWAHTCQEGLQGHEEGGAVGADALRRALLELGRQQHARRAAGRAEDAAAQAAVVPCPPQRPAAIALMLCETYIHARTKLH